MIINNNIQSILKTYGDNKTVKAVKSENSVTNVSKQDEVVLSSQAQSFSQVLQKAQSMSDVRVDKVETLSAQINSGAYYIDATDIAGKILSTRS
ncbi:MAG: flagellar biosynthesis anti-sigma factor protein FlgM [Firmicutes bacterium]|nr:flagellar biosynthesis anti-sigma factor protein FlgM [Bacillota bacterium]